MPLLLRAMLLTLLAFLPPVASAENARLIVTLVGFKSDEGSARMSLWGDAERWLDDDAKVFDGDQPIVDGTSTFVIEALDPGTYGVSAYHDRNDNDRLDTGFLRMPKELFGFSNDAPPRMGPPSFEACAFPVEGEETAITITMRKAF